jgi:hypothetical protein
VGTRVLVTERWRKERRGARRCRCCALARPGNEK